MKLIIAILIVIQPLFGMEWAFKGSFNKKDPIGVRTYHFFDEKRNRPVVAEFWYPIEQKGPLAPKNDNSLWIHPDEVQGASIKSKKTKYSLILISHGHQGDRRDLSWLAEKLVRSGYTVASIDHYGDMRTHFDVLESVSFWNRSLDFSFLLDQMEKEKELKDKIDLTKVGFIGHSLGGMTGLGLAGAKASNVKQIVAQLNGKFNHWDEKQFEEFDFSVSEQSFREPRIKGEVLLCPASYPYSAQALKEIKVPIALMVSVGDEVLPFEEHAFPLIRYLVPQKLKVLNEEISHYSFLNKPTEFGKKMWIKALGESSPFPERPALYEEVDKFATEFFREILNSDKITPN